MKKASDQIFYNFVDVYQGETEGKGMELKEAA